MQDFFLKFADEAEAITYLSQFRSDEGNWLTHKDGENLDVVGTIYQPTGQMIQTEEGEFPEMASLDGFHVNLLSPELPEAMEPFVVEPETPSRVWA